MFYDYTVREVVHCVYYGWIKREREETEGAMSAQSAGTQTQLGYGEAVAA